MFPRWKKYWKAIQKKDKAEELEQLTWERTFLHRLMLKFMTVLDTITENGFVYEDKVSIQKKIVRSSWLSNTIVKF